MACSSDPKKVSLWRGRFRRFLDSGLAVARFCAVEHVSESSFYYWQKKLGPQTSRRSARAEDRDTGAKDHSTGVGDHGVRAEDRNVFRPVTVVPATCGVVVRLPGGVQIEVGIEHLDAIRVVVTETVRVVHGRAAERNGFPNHQAVRKTCADNQATRTVSANNQVIPKPCTDNQVIRKRGGAVSC